MKCEAVKDWLTQCESMQARGWPKKVVRHVKNCRPCRHFARGILRLEDGWRNMPLPDEGRQPSAAFLQKIAELENPAVEVEVETEREAEKPRLKRPRKPVPLTRALRPLGLVGAVAAMLLLGVGGIGFLLVNPHRAPAAGSDVVERLIDLNVKLVNTDDAKERQNIMQELEPALRDDLLKAKLSQEDREFAQSLLEQGRELATTVDPLKEEEYVEKTLKTKLHERAEHAETKDRFDHCSEHYKKFLSYNMTPLWNRAAQSKFGFGSLKKFGVEKDGGADRKGFDKGPPSDKGFFDKKGFDKGGFDKKGKGFEKGGFPMTPDEFHRMQMDYVRTQMEARKRAEETWMQQKGGMRSFGPGGGRKK